MNIVEAAVKDCFKETESKEKAKARIRFSEVSDIFKLYCLLSGVDYKMLKNKVILNNHRMLLSGKAV